MKTIKNKILTVLFLIVIQCGQAQGFANMDFESANISGYSPGFVPTSAALPSWTAYFNGNPQSFIGYNSVSLGGAAIFLEDTNVPGGVPPPIEGSYSVLLQGSIPGQASSVAVGQTGTIPVTAQSLSFFLGTSFGTLQVTFNGQNIPYNVIGNGPNYKIYGANIASYAGQMGELLFTAPIQNAGLLDNVQFSSSSVPEPSTLALGALGALLFGCRRWRNASR